MKNRVDKLTKEGKKDGSGKRDEGRRKETIKSPHKHYESIDSQPRSEEFLNDPRQGTTASWNYSCGQHRDQPNLTE